MIRSQKEKMPKQVLSDFQFEYIENIGDENLIDSLKKNAK